MKTFQGALLKKIRERKGMTFEQLAASSGVSYSTVTSLEYKKRKPTADLLHKLATALDVSLDDFFE